VRSREPAFYVPSSSRSVAAEVIRSARRRADRRESRGARGEAAGGECDDQRAVRRPSRGYAIKHAGHQAGAEELTMNYVDPNPFTERHPNLLWGALGLAVILLGYAAVRALRAPVSTGEAN
jgi:hypothetical protein